MSDGSRRAHAPLLLVALVAAYGSLYPFRFAPPASFERAFDALLAQTQLWTTRGDVAGNIVLFLPIGVAMVYAASRGADVWWRRVVYLAAYFAAAVAFAFVLQVAQIFVPARIAALSDVLWNGVGALAGLIIGQVVLSRLPRWSLHGDGYTGLVLLVLACWLGWRLWPFAPAFSLAQAYRTLKPLLVLAAPDAWSTAAMAVSLMLIAAVVAALRHPHRWFIGAAALGLAVRFVLAGQAISSGAFAGTVIGVIAGLLVLRAGLARAGAWVIAVAMLWYSADALRPFVFSTSHAPASWVPFAALLRGAMDINLASLCGVAFVSGALMLTGTRLYPAPGRWCLLLAAWLVLLELIQQWIPTRTSDLTLALLPVGWWLALRAACGEAKAGA